MDKSMVIYVVLARFRLREIEIMYAHDTQL